MNRAEVLQAVLDQLVDVEAATAMATAPAGTPATYGVLEPGAGQVGDGGDLAEPGRHLVIPFSVRSVVRHSDLGVAALAALALADRFEAGIGGLLVGDGWRANITRDATSGVIPDGQVANVVDGYTAWVVPA